MGATSTESLVRGPEGLSAEWLTGVLRAAGAMASDAQVARFSTSAIGTGQMSDSHRVSLGYADGRAGPASVVLKVASGDPTSRETGARLGAYALEVRFYQELAASLGDTVATCHYAAIEAQTGWFTLLLEDLAPAEQGDEVAGATLGQAQAAVDALARIHAAHWESPAAGSRSWLNHASPLNQGLLTALLPAFAERYGDRVAPEHLDVARRLVPQLDAWLADDKGPRALQHGDFRVNNLLFARDGPRRAVAVDWQTVFFGAAQHDLAYFLGCSLATGDRRAHGEGLVRRYHDGLLEAGVTGLSLDECWERYRRMTFGGLVMTVAASMLVHRTSRGDDMFMAAFARHAQHALDLRSLATLPRSEPAPLRPAPRDEGRHEPTSDELWNESWYFDFVTDVHGLAGYTRIGLYPNRDEAWITLALVRRGGPTVRFVNLALALPTGDGLSVHSPQDGLRADHVCERPLERFSVSLEATGESYDDPGAILRGEGGAATAVSLDLVWVTDGVAYQYRPTTRYEIPCRVRGRVTIDGTAHEIDGQGQRDHSWGIRDWWSVDWLWSAARFEDGGRLQCTAVRIPDRPSLVMGYLQRPGELIELHEATSDELTSEAGLVTVGRLRLPAVDLDLTITPFGDGPLLIAADDGRVSAFLRSACEIETNDGRRALGWVEWNHNRR